VFAFSGRAAKAFSTDCYNNGSGRFKSNYFKTDLESRGLLNTKIGPQLKNFPFYEDASIIYSAIHDFMTDFVGSYYASDSKVASDDEIQAWVKEANGDAQVFDFPSISTTASLVDVLTHMVSLLTLLWIHFMANRIWCISSCCAEC
jgi:hypothetical protein